MIDREQMQEENGQTERGVFQGDKEWSAESEQKREKEEQDSESRRMEQRRKENTAWIERLMVFYHNRCVQLIGCLQ